MAKVETKTTKVSSKNFWKSRAELVKAFESREDAVGAFLKSLKNEEELVTIE